MSYFAPSLTNSVLVIGNPDPCVVQMMGEAGCQVLLGGRDSVDAEIIRLGDSLSSVCLWFDLPMIKGSLVDMEEMEWLHVVGRFLSEMFRVGRDTAWSLLSTGSPLRLTYCLSCSPLDPAAEIAIDALGGFVRSVSSEFSRRDGSASAVILDSTTQMDDKARIRIVKVLVDGLVDGGEVIKIGRNWHRCGMYLPRTS